MKHFSAILLTSFFALGMHAQIPLQFNLDKGTRQSLQMHDGTSVNYTAYERLFYVTNVEDSTYQYLNIYVPDGTDSNTPMFLRTYVGGYMASAAGGPQADDASGRALQEGLVLVIPGTRGRNSVITADKAYAKKHKGVKVGDDIYTGRAPKAILDLKAAIRYLRHFDHLIPGSAERIITDGTSAGGAVSALMGATGNNPLYRKLLKDMGAADERDDVFASVCFCPILDLDHADMAYEWLYNGTDSRQALDETHLNLSNELKQLYPEYINSLNLKDADGSDINSDNFLDHIKREIIRAAQIAKNAGADIPDSLGFKYSSAASFGAPPINGGQTMGQGRVASRPQGMMMRGRGGQQKGEYITDLDMPTYLNYVVSTQPLKTVPAFDSLIEGVNNASGENEEFGDATGTSVNFTDFTAAKNGIAVSAEIRHNAKLMNPMSFLEDSNTDVAPHWYIRHGARDRDTAFGIPFTFATKLSNTGRDVNFLLAWNRPHSGDYALDELFAWIRSIIK